jgi:hypothetical protein
MTTEDKHLGRRYADLFYLLGEERGLIPQVTFKRGRPVADQGSVLQAYGHMEHILIAQ